MSLWGKTDTLADAPTFVDSDTAYLVDTTEAGVASNRAAGLKTSGWNTYTTYTDSTGSVRHKVEPIAPMRVTAADAGDLGVTGNTAVEDTVVADS